MKTQGSVAKWGAFLADGLIISTHAAAFGRGFMGRSMAESLGW
jgi:hypothetical protein